MNREQLFDVIGDVDDRFILEAAPLPSDSQRRRHYFAVAACMVLMIAVSAVGYFCATNDVRLLPSHQTASAFFHPNEMPDSYVVTYPADNERIIVTSGDRYLLARYARGPRPGECRLDMALAPLLLDDAHPVNPNTVYWVEISLYDADGHLLQSGEDKHAQAKRLASLGYEIYVSDVDWTGYWGERKHYTYLCGYFTAEHLRHFPADEKFGYSIDFVHEDSRMRDITFERVTTQ